MTDTAAPANAHPGHENGAPSRRLDQREAAFFVWMRGLRVVRDRGWLGGVCAGIAARANIDPIIVRGMFVVVALVGFPALLVYALGWALLPDADGRIPLQQLGRGRFDPALIAIVVMTFLAFVPVVQWTWSTVFWPFGGGIDGWGRSLIAVWISTLAILIVASGIALVASFVVWVRRRARGESASRAESLWPEGERMPSTDAGVPASDRAPLEPAPPPQGAPNDELAAWRTTHDRWRAEHEAWRQRQVAADAIARERGRQEQAAAAQAFAAEVAERRLIRRGANPRASAVFVLAVLGAALVGGALSALAVREPAVAAPAGLLVAGFVTAVGMVLAGALRRRSGFLAFAAAATVTAGAVSGFVGATPTVLWGHGFISAIGSSPQEYLQPFGDTDLQVFDITSEDFGGSGETGQRFDAGVITVRKGTGETTIWVQPGTTLLLDATLRDGPVQVERFEDGAEGPISAEVLDATGNVDGAPRYQQQITGSGDLESAGTIVPVRLEQLSGSVRIVVTTTGED